MEVVVVVHLTQVRQEQQRLQATEGMELHPLLQVLL
jgi:hypothetical protein